MKVKFTSIFHQLLWSYSTIFLLLFTAIFAVLFIKIATYQVHSVTNQLHQATLADREQLESELFHTLNNIKAWSTLSVMDDLLTDDIDQRITRELEKFKQQYQLKGHLYVLSSKGVLVTADHPLEKTLDLNVWYAHTQTNTPFIDKHSNPVDGSTIIAFWQPVKASFDNQKIIGYLVITYPWQDVTAFLADTTILRHLMLFNQAGLIIHQDEHIPLMNNIDMINSTQKESWYSHLVSQYIEASHEVHYEVTIDQQTFFIETLPNNAAMPLTNAWQWVSLAEQQQVYEPLKTIGINILQLGGIAAGLAFFVIYVLSEHLTKPIQTLTEIAAEIAHTLDLSKRMPNYGDHEIGKLAASFNEMCDNLEKTWQEKNKITDDLQTLNEQLEQKVAERTKHLAWQANHDILTDLPNRALLEERLTLAIARCQRTPTMLAVLFIDLDGFKAVNDNFGHDMGDYLLIDIAKRFLACVREPDTVARLGGDEFVILLELQKVEDINVPLKRICTLVNEPIVVDGKVLKVSPSIGITIYPLDPSDSDGLIRHADQAMYQAKQKGRNQTQFFESETQIKV
jgi:diguanylate cyclase (GGDEF)-like protein